MAEYPGIPMYGGQSNGASALEGGIGGFLLGALLNNGGNGLFGGNGNNKSADTELLQSGLSALASQLQGINSNVDAGDSNILNQMQAINTQNALQQNALNAVTQNYQNAINNMQGQFQLEKSISDLGSQMQLGFKDIQIQSAVEACNVKDLINHGFNVQTQNDLAELRTRQIISDVVNGLKPVTP